MWQISIQEKLHLFKQGLFPSKMNVTVIVTNVYILGIVFMLHVYTYTERHISVPHSVNKGLNLSKRDRHSQRITFFNYAIKQQTCGKVSDKMLVFPDHHCCILVPVVNHSG